MQLPGVGFAGAAGLVDYLDRLGIETLYVSPVMTAVPGSTHGYDVVDPTQPDPSLGGRPGLDALLGALDARAMRLLIDIVPNHMATDPANRWWWATLRQGPGSEAAAWFDIDWEAQDNTVLVPTLGAPLRDVLEGGRVGVMHHDGQRALGLDGQPFPLRAGSLPGRSRPRDAAGWGAVVARQHYRPAYWRRDASEVNYRRFFDIDGLIGVRVEDPVVRRATHAALLELARDERVAGLRVDHVDGLVDPAAYLAWLGTALRAGRRHDPPVVVVEKILTGDERLPADWDVDGTTGYEFSAWVGGLLIDPAGARSIAQAGGTRTGIAVPYGRLALAAKRQVVGLSFGAPLRQLARLTLAALNATSPGHDLTPSVVAPALTELTAHLDVYRTYLDGAGPTHADARRLAHAAEQAAAALDDDEARRAVSMVAAGLRTARAKPAGPARWLVVARRWQQLSGAVMAKGVEDTASYRTDGLLAPAEVGSDPARPARTPAEFHAAVSARDRRSTTLNATSTHDAKRSEDVRARLAVLSEVAPEWNRLVARWLRRYRAGVVQAGGPDVHDQLVVYQTLAGVWPAGAASLRATDRRRVQDYMVKAAREANRRTDWIAPDARYEAVVRAFVARLARPSDPFGHDMQRLIRRIAPAAVADSLALVTLKAVCPGVPDIYQGTEVWDWSLTDPDNRRPVDFDLRSRLLAIDEALDTATVTARRAAVRRMLAGWEDGLVKLHVLRALLLARRGAPELFDRGAYLPLRASGPAADHVMALARHHRGRWVVAVVPRLSVSLAGPGRFAVRRVWEGTAVRLPADAPTELCDVFTGAARQPARRALALDAVLSDLPVAVLTGTSH
jgi:malto-oligosyltrehalose synthase